MPAEDVMTPADREPDDQDPGHDDQGDGGRLLRVAGRVAGQWGLIGHAAALPGDEEAERVALPGAGQ